MHKKEPQGRGFIGKSGCFKNITKRFPGVVANDRINLEVQGEIHALLEKTVPVKHAYEDLGRSLSA